MKGGSWKKESKRQGFGSPFNLTLRPPANAEHCSQAGVSTFYHSKDKFYSFIEGSIGTSFPFLSEFVVLDFASSLKVNSKEYFVPL